MVENDYNYVLEEFKLYFPGLASKTVHWYPSGRHEITVKLQDRTKFIFNFIGKTVRRIPLSDEDLQEMPEDHWRKEFSIRLQTILSDRGWSQCDLAERTGISQVSISKYMNGKVLPNSYTTMRIARALECSVTELTDF